MQWLNSLAMNLLNKNLDGLWARQQVISENLANFETPGYKAKSVSFEDRLKAELSSAGSTKSKLTEKIRDVNPVTTTEENRTFRLDGNGVDLEKENVELLRTQLCYYSTVELLSDTFSRLKAVINADK